MRAGCHRLVLWGSAVQKLALVLTLFGIAILPPAWAQPAATVTSEVQRDRAEMLAYLLKEARPEQVLNSRKRCASGVAQDATDRSRVIGWTALPDAADQCPTVLLRQARDGLLLGLYRDLLVELSGQSAGHEQLPAAIGGAVMRGANQVPIGNQRAAAVTAALALDAGFTVAYQKGERMNAGMPPLAALRPIADRCLRQQESDLGLCYATGYTLGARAVSGQPLASL